MKIIYRLILNILFYIFYVIVVSIIFSFIFPTILVVLGKDIIDPTNPIFDTIQIIIFILVFVVTIICRKYFYLPITKNIKIKKENFHKKEAKKDFEKIENKDKEENELDIQIGKEIK